MFPAFRQRLLIAAAMVVGGLVWLMAAGPLGAADASVGLSLFDARAGVLPGLVVLIAAGLPALTMGLIVAATGHPLAGVFTVATGLTFLAGAGGSIEGYLWRHTLPAGYGWLLAEAGLWAVMLAAMLGAIRRLRPGLRARLGALATDAHWGEQTKLGLPDGRALLAGGICLLVGALICVPLLQSEATAQVIGSLLLAFTVGGLIAHTVVPQSNPVPILLSPLVLAAAAYAHVAFLADFQSHEQVIATWYRGELWGPALALPIFYASAGVTGCALGIGLGQAINEAREQAVTTDG